MSKRSRKPSADASSNPASNAVSPPSAPKPKQGLRQPLAFRARAAPKTPEPGLTRPVAPERIARSRKIALAAAGVVGTLMFFRLGYAIAGYKRDADHYAALETPIPLDVSDRYRSVRFADNFDLDVSSMEWLMGISKLRQQLCSRARGHVLEASVGTGRNTTYYPLTTHVKTVTMVDTSSEMLQVARLKWAQNNPWFINAVFWVKSAADSIPLPTPEAREQGGFDTVVQTMGVCSTPQPEKVLANLGSLCRQDGEARILLLEHGRSYYDWLNRWIDAIAPAHADREGCWFNKDVGEVVRNSGLEIVEQKRYHFGTTWWFVLKPPPPNSKEEADASSLAEDRHTASTSTWWEMILRWR